MKTKLPPLAADQPIVQDENPPVIELVAAGTQTAEPIAADDGATKHRKKRRTDESEDYLHQTSLSIYCQRRDVALKSVAKRSIMPEGLRSPNQDIVDTQNTRPLDPTALKRLGNRRRRIRASVPNNKEEDDYKTPIPIHRQRRHTVCSISDVNWSTPVPPIINYPTITNSQEDQATLPTLPEVKRLPLRDMEQSQEEDEEEDEDYEEDEDLQQKNNNTTPTVRKRVRLPEPSVTESLDRNRKVKKKLVCS